MAVKGSATFYSLPEFLRELGMSKPTFLKYLDGSVLPPPPLAGTRRVYSGAYLEACRKAWKRYKWNRPGRPPRASAAVMLE